MRFIATTLFLLTLAAILLLIGFDHLFQFNPTVIPAIKKETTIGTLQKNITTNNTVSTSSATTPNTFRGPVGAPHIIGPSSPPPNR